MACWLEACRYTQQQLQHVSYSSIHHCAIVVMAELHCYTPDKALNLFHLDAQYARRKEKKKKSVPLGVFERPRIDRGAPFLLFKSNQEQKCAANVCKNMLGCKQSGLHAKLGGSPASQY